MGRVLMFQSERVEDGTLSPAIQSAGHEITVCPDGESLLEHAVEGKPDVAIYVLRPDPAEDLAVLRLLRRAAPKLPLILLAMKGSLDTQRLLQGIRPIYYAVLPVDPPEVLDAIQAALKGGAKKASSRWLHGRHPA